MRVIALNPALPIFSRILVSGNGLNYKNIIEFIIIMIIVFMAPGICYRLTGDEYKSSTLCLMPAAMWGMTLGIAAEDKPLGDIAHTKRELFAFEFVMGREFEEFDQYLRA